ncbi:phosphoglycerate transport system transcriptional regulatory protein PgtA [Vibrio cholerae]|nr:phosphoglycerate transport system transcriptional regulatory protein PgtA [Vibrio cholerae]
MIVGESGCGRHTIAYLIHQLTTNNGHLPWVCSIKGRSMCLCCVKDPMTLRRCFTTS